MLNLYKLEVFAAVVQAGTFSAAGERLLMSQPAVSQHIQDLEAALGTKLFRRSRRGVELMPAGSTLWEYTQQILALVADAELAVVDVKQLVSAQISLGATPGAGVYLLPDWIQDFRSHYPNLTVAMQTGITPQILADLRTGRVDLGFVEGEMEAVEDVETLVLREDEQFVVVGRKHPWWARVEVRVEDLAGQTFVVRQRNSQSRLWLEATLHEHGIRPAIGAEFDAVESIKRAVAIGTCLTVLPDYVFHAEREMDLLRGIPVRARLLTRTLKLVWLRGRRFTPVQRTFLRHLAARLPALQAIA